MRLLIIFALSFFAIDVCAETIRFQNEDDLKNHFDLSEHTFEGNRAHFKPSNVQFNDANKSVRLYLRKEKHGDREYTGAEIRLKNQLEQKYHFGRYDVELKPVCVSGSITGFFMFRWNPWQELDIEFVGRSKNQIQTSLVSNFAPQGIPHNHPDYKPRTFQLNFDPCASVNKYSIEWSSRFVRFYANDILIDERLSDIDLIPPFPADLIINTWLNGDPSWTGPIQDQDLPAYAEIQSVSFKENRIDKLVNKMTIEEKIWMLSGSGFATQAIPRLGIPAIEMTDGPVGIRFGKGTVFPAGIALAATFNPELAHNVSKALGKEALDHGKSMLLGPAVDILRTPWAGRAFESLGEDPFLASRIAENYVSGLQSENVMACVKHFVVNNHEINRMYVDVRVDERALREIYYPPFAAAINAGAAAIMASYNKINGSYASEQSQIISDLRNEFKFNGILVSDWGATHSTVSAANAGLDIEMPNAKYFGLNLYNAVKNGEVSLNTIDAKIYRILNQIEKFGYLDNKTPTAVPNPIRHLDLAEQMAIESFVLLKNNNHVLPLNNPQKIAVIGPNALTLRSGGGGSSYVEDTDLDSPLEEIYRFARKSNLNIQIYSERGVWHPGDVPPPALGFVRTWTGAKYEAGLTRELFNNPDLSGNPARRSLDQVLNYDWDWMSPDYSAVPEDGFSMRLIGQFVAPISGDYELLFTHDDGLRLYWNQNLVIDKWNFSPLSTPISRSSFKVNLKAGEIIPIEIHYYEKDTLATFYFGVLPPGTAKNTQSLQRAKELAADSDISLIFVGFNRKTESEGFDRENLSLPEGQDELIQEVSKLSKKSVVIINSGSAIEMPWLNQVDAVLQAWYPGSRGAKALARVLFGDASPGGKLPLTYPVKMQDSPAIRDFPERDGILQYYESIFVGYRFYDKFNTSVLFPFGHGLNYSQFQISELNPAKILNDHINLNIKVKNIGKMKASETIQVYFEPKVNPLYPVRELKAFKKVNLEPASEVQTDITIPISEFKFYSTEKNKWIYHEKPYRLSIGTSSRHLVYSIEVN